MAPTTSTESIRLMLAAELDAVWAAYIQAVDEHSEATSVVYTHSRGDALPTAAEMQREADTRVIMVGARTAYLEVRQRSRSR